MKPFDEIQTAVNAAKNTVLGLVKPLAAVPDEEVSALEKAIIKEFDTLSGTITSQRNRLISGILEASTVVGV